MEQRDKEKNSERGLSPNDEVLELPRGCQRFRKPDNQALSRSRKKNHNAATRENNRRVQAGEQ